MKILAVDTSTKTQLITVSDDNELLDYFINETPLNHGDTLHTEIINLLNKTSLTINQIDGFSVCRGPGSFTGLRVGIAAMSGFCFANNKPFFGTSSLKLKALGIADFKGYLCPMLDARKKEVYTALYKSDGKGNVVNLGDEIVIKPDHLVQDLEKIGKNIYACGDGLTEYNDIFKDYSWIINKNNKILKNNMIK